MDVASHWLMGSGATNGRTKFWVAGLMGVLPDLIVFIPNSFFLDERPEIDENTVTADFGWYAWEAYQVTHSLVWATIGFLFTWIFLRSGVLAKDCLQITSSLHEMLQSGFGFPGLFIFSMTSLRIQPSFFRPHFWPHSVISKSMDIGGVHLGFGSPILRSFSQYGRMCFTRNETIHSSRNGRSASTAAVACGPIRGPTCSGSAPGPMMPKPIGLL